MVFYTLFEGGVALPARRLALGFSLVTTDDEIKSRSAVVGLRGRQLAFFASAIVWALQRDSAVPHVRPYVLMWVEQAERCVVVGWGGGCGVGTQATPSGRCVRTRLSRATHHDSSRAPLHLWCRPYLVDGEWLSLTDAVPSHTSDAWPAWAPPEFDSWPMLPTTGSIGPSWHRLPLEAVWLPHYGATLRFDSSTGVWVGSDDERAGAWTLVPARRVPPRDGRTVANIGDMAAWTRANVGGFHHDGAHLECPYGWTVSRELGTVDAAQLGLPGVVEEMLDALRSLAAPTRVEIGKGNEHALVASLVLERAVVVGTPPPPPNSLPAAPSSSSSSAAAAAAASSSSAAAAAAASSSSSSSAPSLAASPPSSSFLPTPSLTPSSSFTLTPTPSGASTPLFRRDSSSSSAAATPPSARLASRIKRKRAQPVSAVKKTTTACTPRRAPPQPTSVPSKPAESAPPPQVLAVASEGAGELRARVAELEAQLAQLRAQHAAELAAAQSAGEKKAAEMALASFKEGLTFLQAGPKSGQ